MDLENQVEQNEAVNNETAPGPVATDQVNSDEVKQNQDEVDNQPKTFTQEEVDAIVKRRIDREQRKLQREYEQNNAPKDDVVQVAVKRENYPTDEAYVDALSEAKAQAILEKKRTDDFRNKIEDSWNERIENAKDKYSDFDQVIQNPNLKISPMMADAIKSTDNGEDIAYFLGINPDEAKRIFDLPPALQIKEIGKLEGKLLDKPIQVKKPSSAPEPINPIKSNATTKVTDTTDPRSAESMSPEEWIKAERKRQEAKYKNG
jgi:hypothetical protein